MSGAGSKMENIEGTDRILTAEVTKNKMAKTTKICLKKFARNFGLKHRPSSGAERKKCKTYKDRYK